MDVSAMHRTLDTAPAAATVVPVETATNNRDVVQAVKAVNGAELFGQDNELVFQRDRSTQRMVIRLINRKTDEVISQIPPEYVLRMAQNLKSGI